MPDDPRTMSYEQFLGRPPVEVGMPQAPAAPQLRMRPQAQQPMTDQDVMAMMAQLGGGQGGGAAPAQAARPPQIINGQRQSAPPASPAGAGLAASLIGNSLGGGMAGALGASPAMAQGATPQHTMQITNGGSTSTYGFGAPFSPGAQLLSQQNGGQGIPPGQTVSGYSPPMSGQGDVNMGMQGMPGLQQFARQFGTGLAGASPEALAQAAPLYAQLLGQGSQLMNSRANALQATAQYGPGGIAHQAQGTNQQNADIQAALATHTMGSDRVRDTAMSGYLARPDSTAEGAARLNEIYQQTQNSGQPPPVIMRNPLAPIAMSGPPSGGGAPSGGAPSGGAPAQGAAQARQGANPPTPIRQSIGASLGHQVNDVLRASPDVATAATQIYNRFGAQDFHQNLDQILLALRERFSEGDVNAWVNRAGFRLLGDRAASLNPFGGGHSQESNLASMVRNARGIPAPQTPAEDWGGRLMSLFGR